MADDIAIKDASDVSRVVATDEVGGRGFQLVKICYGADGAVSLVDGAGNPLPVGIVGTVPITGTVAIAGGVAVSGPLTDAELRAAAVQVSGPLTDAQLRASEVPISAAALPLPAGAATQTTLAALATLVLAESGAHASGEPGVLALAVRSDDDATPLAGNGERHPFVINEMGRLKVAGMPGTIVPTTGSITASGQSVQCTVTMASNVMCYVTGTFAGHNCTFEGSIDGGTAWFAIQAVRSNANTIELVTGALSAAPAYAWEMSVNGLTHCRVRATGHTSGTANWRFQPAPYATEPIPAAQISGTQPVSGTVTATVTGGTVVGTTPTASNVNSAASTNATSVKASAGTVYSVIAFNAGAGVAFVKFYNKASAPTVGTDVPIWVLAVPAGGHAQIQFGVQGNRFGTGIALAITGAAADSDTTAVAAAQVKVSTAYV